METAFPIQSATIADALAGRDVLGKARTGSGKTLGFGLPAISRLAESGQATPNQPRAIVLVPTRELAMQVNDALEPFAHAMQVSLKLIAGGLSMSKQIQALDRGVHLVVATPGRLADLVRRGDADMSAVSLVVLDEADHMAEMGFMDEINEILVSVPSDAQTLLFSATLDGDVDKLVSAHMTDPALHDVTGGDDGPSTMSHVVLNVPPHIKYQTATRIAARDGRTIVFVRTKLACDRIAADMRSQGVLAVALHGDKSQNERNHAITGFRAGTIPVLVATDVAARGIHVDHVDLVLQLDPPHDFKDYTHRAGRTARAGSSGLVVTLVLPHQRRTMDRIVENAGVDPTFRKLRGEDEDSLRILTDLTGARTPSGEYVREPLPERAGRGGRPERGRSGRQDRGRSSDRSPRGDRGARQSNARRPAPARSSYPPARDDSREKQLREREERLAQRERELNEREQAARAPQRRSHEDRPQRSSRPAYGADKGRSGGDKGKSGGYQGRDNRAGRGERSERPYR
ncbi:DEAD/DEAH box helicase, partial [Demequina sediminicola]|uniref:DEAD/DEAH box helicase n=1 Tax=Demequina sediminicola TaxID=1095026 RepID=UPI000782B60E